MARTMHVLLEEQQTYGVYGTTEARGALDKLSELKVASDRVW